MPASPKREAKGITTAPPKPRNPKQPKQQNLKGLTKQQNRVINQTQTGDLALGAEANQRIGAIESAYDQPFDYSQYNGPAAEDYQGFIDEQMGNYNSAWDKRNNPILQQQMGDFEQQMANRGIPMGSELYNREKSRLEQSQADQRQQAYAANQGEASQAANSFFNIGSQANQNKYSMAMAGRNAPLSEYSNLMAAQSGMGMQNLGYSQQRGLADQQGQIARSMPRGGGGGGGGAGPIWSQMGFSSPMEYQAWQTDQDRANKQWEWANNPQYKQNKGPSYGAQLGGGILGSVLGGWAQSGFKGIF